ncbi:pyrroloquinoline quinone-dependent dehydrogenase [Rhodopseudomonas sp. WA056]|uniref:pyrroloquinoline quinone-dependent dehydrogenase n=1 Tax=Rhodopseudomonas sp. WA056 TaxID=2269367 RepID=UPI0013DEBA11|nr:pyrroloquinoline quinone-dependent dehydrogenase [Rhodopseudomonas sp. WA056]NEW86949.1 pyrroloquinoline quinone-dependent dehydrogenase [Rhodopseudomonas sp. WA056]
MLRNVFSRRPTTKTPHRIWGWLYLLFASLTGLLGAATAVLGVRLLMLGGTSYYLAAGLLLTAGGLLAWLRRDRLAFSAFGLALLLTLAWSLVEIGGKGWQPAWGLDLAARVGLLAALLAAAALAFVFRRYPPHSIWRRGTTAGLLAAVVALGVLVTNYWERTEEATTAGDRRPSLAAGAEPVDAAAEWTAFGGTTLGRRYTTLVQIHTGNVSELQEAWTFRSGDLAPGGDRVYYSSQNTPIKAADLLYICTSSNQVHALDPGTGEVRWHFDPKVDPSTMESLFSAACRAVAYFDDGDPAGRPDARGRMPAVAGKTGPMPRGGSNCHRRVFVATADGRLIALDAVGGFVCRSFGNDGVVDLSEGMGLREAGFASNTSGATVAGGLLIIGQQVSDNQRRDAPSGVVRAYDAVSGELRWAWDALRPDPQAPLAPGEIYPRGTPNVWNVISADESLGLAFLGTGNPGADHWGGNRTAEEDRFTAAVVAVDLATGATRWSFTTVQHDLWDYDIGAQPMLLDVTIDGVARRAVLQGTKAGDLFLLDAATGEPLRPVVQRAVPQQGGLPGDRLSPTQPQSVFFPNLGGIPGRDPETIDARHIWGVTPIDAALCRIGFHQRRYDGIFTPPTVEAKGIVLLPGTVGGMNWGGLGFDPGRRLVIANYSRLPNTVDMTPRAEVADRPVGSGGARPDQTTAPHAGTPYGVDRPMWLSILDVPCLAPPWGFIAATNIDTGELAWAKPLGTGFDMGPLGIPTRLKIAMGTPNLGGPLVTAGGLTFIGAAQDNFLRAFETATGRLLWQHRLPAGAQAGVMSYQHNGRQYVAVTATGHARFETTLGAYLKVFALGSDQPDLTGEPPSARGDDNEKEGP